MVQPSGVEPLHQDSESRVASVRGSVVPLARIELAKAALGGPPSVHGQGLSLSPGYRARPVSLED